MKKIISLVLSLVMLTSIISTGTAASANPVNTAQTAAAVGVGTVAQTFRLGYPNGSNGDYINESSVYYKFVAPTTDYYEFSATGYENTVYSQGNKANVSIQVSDSMGKSVEYIYVNEITYVTKEAALLNAGQTYIIELEDYLSNTLSYSSSDYGYAEQTIYFTIGVHSHDFVTYVYNYSDGSYNTTYDCLYCDYESDVYTPAPNSNQQSTVVSHDSNGYSETTYFKPSKTKISKLTSKKKALTVKWVKSAYVSGYQIQLATDKKFKANKKTVNVKKATSTSKTISKLKANKKYYVRVRTYVIVNGEKKYSGWSAVKSVKTK